MQQVHLRINDAATGKPTPVRLRVTDAEGRYHAPLGRLTSFATGPNQDVGGNVFLGGKAWAYIDGACEINLPPGPLHISARKGPEYRPLEADVQLVAGKLSMRFEIQRWSDIRQEGWHPGDTRAHFIPPHAALLEAQAEDLAVVQLLARVTEVKDAFGKGQPAIPNLLAFSGQAPSLQAPDSVVAVNTENYHRELGSLGLLHCHRVVYPLTFGGADGADDWTLQDWCGQCHRKRGLVVWTRTLHESQHYLHGEPLVDALLGEIDAFEIDHFEDSPFDALPLWYDLLNLGLRVPLAGASGKDGNGVALGTLRTCVLVPPAQGLSCATWIEGLRAGHSFVTNGPMLSFSVNGQPPGSVVPAAANDALRVQATARSLTAFDQLEILCNGRVVSAAGPAGDPAAATLEFDLPAEESCWLAARCKGQAQVFHRPANQRLFAHSSPIHVEIPGKPFRPNAKTAQKFTQEIDRMITWCEKHARCETPAQRQRLTAGFREATASLSRMAAP